MGITSLLAILKLRQESLSRGDVNKLECTGGIITRHASAQSSQSSGARHNMTQFFNEIKSHPMEHPYPTFSGMIYPSFQKSPIKPYENLFSHPFFFVVDFFIWSRFSGARDHLKWLGPKGHISSHLSHLSANCGWRINSCRQASGFKFDQSQWPANSDRRDRIRAQAKPPNYPKIERSVKNFIKLVFIMPIGNRRGL